MLGIVASCAVTACGDDSSTGGSGGGSTLCGNRAVDPGEDCDDANSDDLDGCKSNCRFGCADDPDCSDGTFCNGDELCSPEHRCTPGTARPDGTDCGDVTRVCLTGKCTLVSEMCGDGRVVPPEECDDDNQDPSDGCTSCAFTCVSVDAARNCAQSNPCAGTSVCDDPTHTCGPITLTPDYTPCSGGVCVSGECRSEYCSDGTRQSGEECDDGNRDAADGCEPDCRYTCDPSDAARDCSAPNACQNDGACNTTTHMCSLPAKKPNGTACGSALNCVEGNCRAVECRDGILAAGAEECDDGNNKDADGCANDCGHSCKNAIADCPTALACRKPTCFSFACGLAPDSAQNDQPCNTGAGAATCKAGACTAGQCGDGVEQTGEECDFGTGENRLGSGCEPLCSTSCHANGECDDADPCNGVETCDAVSVGGHAGRRCTPQEPRPDGTDCGGGKLCVNGSCRLSFCGDSVTDPRSGEECEPPHTELCDSGCHAYAKCDLTGTWAAQLTSNVDVTGPAIEPGSGTVVQIMRLSLQQSSLSVTGGLRACGLSVPDLVTTPSAGSETFGPAFPDSLFDSPNLPTATFSGSLSGLARGATLSAQPSAILLGVDLGDPFGAWPEVVDLRAGTGGQIVDHDNDANPGVTVVGKTGPLPSGNGFYTHSIVNIDDVTNLGRADRLHLVLRRTVTLTGITTSCDALTGSAAVNTLDLHVVGCRRAETGLPCEQRESDLADAVRPEFAVKSTTFTAKRVANGASCAAVRSAVR